MLNKARHHFLNRKYLVKYVVKNLYKDVHMPLCILCTQRHVCVKSPLMAFSHTRLEPKIGLCMLNGYRSNAQVRSYIITYICSYVYYPAKVIVINSFQSSTMELFSTTHSHSANIILFLALHVNL